ncbi:MAG: Ig-like domain-containing protein [Myxococcaceae bacterium]|nr:Ig-like domain-containing protein [Myxococcaceae bacterium]
MGGVAHLGRKVGALLALLCVSGCLDPGDPVLAVKDDDPPELVRTVPAEGELLDPAGAILVTFSERMDERSLRPGIWLAKGKDRIPTRVEVPPPDPLGIPEASQQEDVEYTVKVSGESALSPDTDYVLVLDPVLTDTEGNALVGPAGEGRQIVLGFHTSP